MRWVSVGAILAIVLAGCMNNGAGAVDPAEEPKVLTTGFLRGVVVDPTIRPIENAVVTIFHNGTQQAMLTTDADGEFGVGGLPPGPKTLNVTKPGFIPRNAAASVVAGEVTPEPITITITPLPADAEFVVPYVWKGQVACGSTPQNWCAGINLVTGINLFPDESFKFLFDDFMLYGRTPDFLQAEFVWEPNMDLSRYAYAAMWASTWDEWNSCLCTPNLFVMEGGSTHIIGQANHAVLAELDVGLARGVGVAFSVGTGADDNLQDPNTYSVMFNQPFEGFFHAFYGCLPPTGWLFTESGDPPCDPRTLEGG